MQLVAAQQNESSATTTVAAFDVDGTLVSGDTFVPGLASIVGWPMVLRSAGTVRHGRAALKEALVASLSGLAVDDVDRLARRYFDSVTRFRLNPDVLAALTAHRRHGHAIVVVSATPTILNASLAAWIGARANLSTVLEERDGRLTGRIDGENCVGAEKRRRLERFCEQSGATLLHAYGNSGGDREMLGLADHAHWVDRRGNVGTFRQ
jgi:phosphatidylglycerophosphatase C